MRAGHNINFQVGGCPWKVTSRSTLWVHFVHCHVWYTVVILEEGSYPIPCSPMCCMLFILREINGSHQATTV